MKNDTRKIRVFLLDDHHLVRDGIKALLSEDKTIEVVGEASEGQELFRKIKHLRPDVVLADVSLPGMSGIEITRKITEDYPDTKVMMLSMYTNEEFITKSIKAGAKGYLPKNTTRKELTSAIQAVSQDREYFAGSVSHTLLSSFVQKVRKHPENREDQAPSLTARETEILKLFARGLSNSDIANELFISIRTVESHKNHIMSKLGLKTPAELMLYAIRNKIVTMDGNPGNP